MQLVETLSHLGFHPEDYTINGSDFSMTSNEATKPTENQLQRAWEEVQLKKYDVALLIGEYVKDCERDLVNDSSNIVDGLLHSFNYTYIEKPTNFQLLELKAIVEAKEAQRLANEESLIYLMETDWKILRHIRQTNLGIATSLTEEEYSQLELTRNEMSMRITR